MADKDISEGGITVGVNAKIHPDSRISAPAYIGDNVEIGANVVISNSVIGNNVSVGTASRIIGSVVWNDVQIGIGVKLMNTIITSRCDIKRDLSYLNTVYSGANTLKIEGLGIS